MSASRGLYCVRPSGAVFCGTEFDRRSNPRACVRSFLWYWFRPKVEIKKSDQPQALAPYNYRTTRTGYTDAGEGPSQEDRNQAGKVTRASQDRSDRLLVSGSVCVRVCVCVYLQIYVWAYV